MTSSGIEIIIERDNAARSLGVEVLSVASGKSKVRFRVSSASTNGWGVTHGGVVFLLADIAFAYAANADGPQVVAQTANVSFTAATRPGDVLVATATESISEGRQRVFDVVVERESDSLIVAKVRGYGFLL